MIYVPILKLTAAWRADPILLALVHCFYDYENLILATGIINIQLTNIVTITGGRSICTTQAHTHIPASELNTLLISILATLLRKGNVGEEPTRPHQGSKVP